MATRHEWPALVRLKSARYIHPKLLTAWVGLGIKVQNSLGYEALAFIAMLAVYPESYRPQFLLTGDSHDCFLVLLDTMQV